MPWNNQNSYAYNRPSILQNAPNASGVYALFTRNEWVYIGESGDIQARLLEHLRTDQQENPCIVRYNPAHFSYELWPANQRVQRQNQLIVELRSVCNQRLG